MNELLKALRARTQVLRDIKHLMQTEEKLSFEFNHPYQNCSEEEN